jgi:hypothetical protein
MVLSLRRLSLAAVVSFVAALGAASAASAQITLSGTVAGNLTLRKLNQNVAFPPGSTFTATITPTSGGNATLSGSVSVPTFSSTLSLVGLPVANATLQLVPTQPVSGSVTGLLTSSGTITATTAATINLLSLNPTLTPFINLVTPGCRTSSPVVFPLSFSGPLTSLTAPLTFNGSVTIPPLTHCGLLTPTLSLLMSGPNNPVSLTLTPTSSSSSQ